MEFSIYIWTIFSVKKGTLPLRWVSIRCVSKGPGLGTQQNGSVSFFTEKIIQTKDDQSENRIWWAGIHVPLSRVCENPILVHVIFPLLLVWLAFMQYVSAAVTTTSHWIFATKYKIIFQVHSITTPLTSAHISDLLRIVLDFH